MEISSCSGPVPASGLKILSWAQTIILLLCSFVLPATLPSLPRWGKVAWSSKNVFLCFRNWVVFPHYLLHGSQGDSSSSSHCTRGWVQVDCWGELHIRVPGILSPSVCLEKSAIKSDSCIVATKCFNFQSSVSVWQ